MEGTSGAVEGLHTSLLAAGKWERRTQVREPFQMNSPKLVQKMVTPARALPMM